MGVCFPVRDVGRQLLISYDSFNSRISYKDTAMTVIRSLSDTMHPPA